ncbi:hypothetical protein MRX96_047882 [Rhipicephalus microplus]
MAATRRLVKELHDIRTSGTKCFRDIQVDEKNMLTWQGLIVPDNSPYNKGGLSDRDQLPGRGQVCLPIISADNWKPATKTDQVIQALIALVNDPEPEHPLRADLAEEYSKDRKKFLKNAEEFTKKHSEKRPPD